MRNRTNVLETPQGRPTRHSDHRDRGDKHCNPLNQHPHGITSPSVPSRGSSWILLGRVPCLGITKTDLTRGRSVALLTRLHPKCPFQVELLRARASWRCFLVLGYYEVPGL